MNPKRRDGFEIEYVGGEVILVDAENRRVHALNETAAAVWQCCDGTRPLADLPEAVRQASGLEVPAEMAELAVSELEEAGVLEEAPALRTMTRRTYLERFGQAAAVATALPMIQSVVAPSPAAAQSLGGGGGPSGGGTTTMMPTTTMATTTTPAPSTTGV